MTSFRKTLVRAPWFWGLVGIALLLIIIRFVYG